jgi:hypothetical protein
MMTYENNPAMKRYIDRIKEAGEIVRSAKVSILGIDRERFMSAEEAAHRLETVIQREFTGLSKKLSKRVSSDACDAITSVVGFAHTYPELINDVEYAIQCAMKKW